MRKCKLIISLVLTLYFQTSYSQFFTPELTIPVVVNGTPLTNAWAGGMDVPQFSVVDMNGDGIKDLFMFDADQGRITTYINNGTPDQVDYHYAPQFINNFPKLHDWAVLVDYNCDGKEDIFTCSYFGGATVYKNVSSTGNLQFVLESPLLYSSYSTILANLFIHSNDLASFNDIDGDGDLDIVTVSASNSSLEFHKNYSMENFGICDSLIFILDNDYWGSIGINAGSNESDNLLTLDMDGDGDQDLLTGSYNIASYNSLKYIGNTGSSANASLVLVDDSFPSYDVPAYVRMFPAAFTIDVNNDGKKDLIISPQHMNTGENVHNAYFYEDTSSTTAKTFTMIQDDFLGGEMIDVGTGANVRFVDVNNDGLQDMVIGNFNKREKNGNDSTSLWYFKNTGSATNPAFQLITNNFANSMTSGQYAMAPAFGDIDGDLDQDMLVGVNDGTIKLFTNTAGNFSLTTTNYQGIDVGSFCAPFLFDINQDGLTDLICGNRNGKLSYYENTGTAVNPVFTLVNSFLGQVNVTDTVTNVYGNSYPFLHYENGSLELLVGSLGGSIFRYGNITGNLAGTFTLINSQYGYITEQTHVTVDGTDLNGDGLMDLLTGNFAGGATIYKQVLVLVNEISGEQASLCVYPNPATNIITIFFPDQTIGTVKIFDSLGKLIDQFESSGELKYDVSGFSEGLYTIVYSNARVYSTQKLMVIGKNR